MPGKLASLDEEDVSFIKKFVLASGSLKEVAGIYGVAYPTVRLRLDRLIQKIRLGDRRTEPYIALIKRLAVKDKLDFDTAKLLINEYKKLRRGTNNADCNGFYNYFADFSSRVCRGNDYFAGLSFQTGVNCRDWYCLPSRFQGELFILLNVVTNVVMTSAADNAVGGGGFRMTCS